MAMEVMQVLTALTIYYPTYLLDPEIQIELVNDTLLYTRINRRIQFHKFESGVKWPGNVTVLDTGCLGMQFEKKEPGEWKVPFRPVNSKKFNLTNADCPKRWEFKLAKIEKKCPNVYLVTLQPVKRMFFHINVGHYIAIHKTRTTREGKVLDIFRQFSPLPKMPFKSINEPNRPMGKFDTMEMNLQIVTRRQPVGSFGHWLLNRTIGSTVNVTNPYGTFFRPLFKPVEYLHVITSSTAISGVLNILIYVLQTSKKIKTIQLLFFNRNEKDIFLKDELTSLTMVEERFVVKHILSAPTREWRGLRGNLTIPVLEQFIPRYNKNTTEGHFCAICAHSKFYKTTERYLLEEFQYPDVHIHAFLGE